MMECIEISKVYLTLHTIGRFIEYTISEIGYDGLPKTKRPVVELTKHFAHLLFDENCYIGLTEKISQASEDEIKIFVIPIFPKNDIIFSVPFILLGNERAYLPTVFPYRRVKRIYDIERVEWIYRIDLLLKRPDIDIPKKSSPLRFKPSLSSVLKGLKEYAKETENISI